MKKEKIQTAVDYIFYIVGFLIVIAIGYILFCYCSQIGSADGVYNPDTLRYLTSTISQTLAGVFGVLGAITLYKLQALNKDIDEWFLKNKILEPRTSRLGSFVKQVVDFEVNFEKVIKDYHNYKCLIQILNSFIDDFKQNYVPSRKEIIEENECELGKLNQEKDIYNRKNSEIDRFVIQDYIDTAKEEIINFESGDKISEEKYADQIKTNLYMYYKQKCNVIESLKKASALSIMAILVSIFFLLNIEVLFRCNPLVLVVLVTGLIGLTGWCLFRYLQLIIELVDH